MPMTRSTERPSFGVNADGSERAFTYRDINGQYLINYEIPLFYKNAMGGEYQKYVGGSYHATEIFDFNGDVAELLDASQPVAYPVISWVRLAPVVTVDGDERARGHAVLQCHGAQAPQL